MEGEVNAILEKLDVGHISPRNMRPSAQGHRKRQQRWWRGRKEREEGVDLGLHRERQDRVSSVGLGFGSPGLSWLSGAWPLGGFRAGK